MLQPIAKFRISVKFTDSKLNCPILFFIWADDKSLAAYVGESYYAVTVDRSLISSGKTIEIHLSAERLSIGYVCHEIFHAVVFWADRNRLKIQSDKATYVDEERCASLHGAIVEKFYHKMAKLKFIDAADFFDSKKYPYYKFITIK